MTSSTQGNSKPPQVEPYTIPGRLAEVCALIQVLGTFPQSAVATARIEAIFKNNSTSANSWLDLANQHAELFITQLVAGFV